MIESQPDPLNPQKKLYTYEHNVHPFELPMAAGSNLDAINEHIEKHIGSAPEVFHEIISDQVHLDVITIPPNDRFDEWTLITSGMSDRPMKPPSNPQKQAYAELVIRLPADWPVPMGPGAKWKGEDAFWPVRLLKTIARFPHKCGAYIWVGHTLDNGQPAEPWSTAAPYNAVFLGPSRTLPDAFENLNISAAKTIKFMAVYPAYIEESALARKDGAEALWNRFVENTVTDVIDPARPNLALPPKGGSFWRRLLGQ